MNSKTWHPKVYRLVVLSIHAAVSLQNSSSTSQNVKQPMSYLPAAVRSSLPPLACSLYSNLHSIFCFRFEYHKCLILSMWVFFRDGMGDWFISYSKIHQGSAMMYHVFLSFVGQVVFQYMCVPYPVTYFSAVDTSVVSTPELLTIAVNMYIQISLGYTQQSVSQSNSIFISRHCHTFRSSAQDYYHVPRPCQFISCSLQWPL